MPYRFSEKGIKKLTLNLELSSHWEPLLKSGSVVDGKLTESSVRAFFDDATKDDKSTVYFDEKKQSFVVVASFESGTWSNNLRLHEFDFEDFEYRVLDLE